MTISRLASGLCKNLSKLILSYVDEEDYPRLAFCTKHSIGLFKQFLEPGLRQAELVKLMNLIYQADYQHIEKIVNHDFTLIFESFLIKLPNGQYEISSPLTFVFKHLDAYTWKLFQKKIDGLNDPKTKNKYMALFKQHAERQKEFITLTPLFDAYDTVALTFQEWVKFYGHTEGTAHTAAIKNLTEKFSTLPFHMKKEFFRIGNAWLFLDFNIHTHKPPNNEFQVADIFGENQRVANVMQDFLIRGSFEIPQTNCINFSNFEHDRSAFRILYETRMKDFQDLLLSLEVSCEHKQKQLK